MRRTPLVIAALLCAVATPVLAAGPFMPDVTLEASPTSVAGRSIDILDLVPGMTVEAVEHALADLHGADALATEMTSFRVGGRGVTVETVEFVSTLNAGDDDNLKVFFAGPAAANQAFAIARTVRYSDVLTAPTVASIADALIAKYGAASYNSRDYRETVTSELGWVFSGGDQISCMGFGGYGSGPGCPVDWTLSEYRPQSLENIAREALDFDLAIVAKIQTHQSDRSRTVSFTVTVSDLLRRKSAAGADTQALFDELERVHQQASQPAAAPAM